MTRKNRPRPENGRGVDSSASPEFFPQSYGLAASQIYAINSGRDTTIHVNPSQTQLAAFTAGALTGSAMTVGLFGSPGHF
ncbi:hypothetical protein FA13DRAFT_1739905 [Coprinellus micaceus]|uniref:Uncharacterized protein n=1 Tax=Coprinellus micaceus TaxID=71717 RepID=A0A4Y7SQT9_COPMI|nr:hypothetical protein FA13DRAFT_1739905 [Coprinellus micaceus]